MVNDHIAGLYRQTSSPFNVQQCCAAIFHKQHSYSFFFLSFPHLFSHFYVGSMCLMRRLHLARSCVSSLDNSLSDKSFLMLSNHLRFGLPLLLFPGSNISYTRWPSKMVINIRNQPYHNTVLPSYATRGLVQCGAQHLLEKRKPSL